MLTILANWTGYRTYAAHTAQILTVLAAMCTTLTTYAGGITLENGVTATAMLGMLSMTFSGLGGIFQRIATANLQAAVKVSSVLFLLCGSAFGLERSPVAIVTGQRSADPGDEIILDGGTSENDPLQFEWRMVSSAPELKGKKQLTPADSGKTCKLASHPGTHVVMLLVANKHGIDFTTYTVTVAGSVYCPPAPAPGPTPIVPVIVPLVPVPGPVAPVVPVPIVPPAPPIPAPDALPLGEFDGLPAKVRVLALTVNSATRPAEAVKLADALEAIAAQLSAGTLKSPLSIVSAIGTAFNGSVPKAWDADFRTKAIAAMKTLYEAGKLATPDRWAAMLREVEVGLRSVK